VGLTRGIDAATLAAMDGVFFPVVMVHVDWPGGAIRAHSGVGAISWGGHSWTGVGEFGSVEVPEESGGLAAQPANIGLVGLPDELDAYLGDPVRNRACTIYVGVVTERAGNVLIGSPFSVFAGYVDAMADTVRVRSGDGDSGLIRGVTLTVAPGPSQRSIGEIYHTDEDQRRLHPNDTAGRLVIHAEAWAERQTWPE